MCIHLTFTLLFILKVLCALFNLDSFVDVGLERKVRGGKVKIIMPSGKNTFFTTKKKMSPGGKPPPPVNVTKRRVF